MPQGREMTNVANLIDLLNKVFRDLMPKHNYAVREGQIELAGQMLSSLQNRSVALCEAEVGTGKTHAYIIAAVLNARYNENLDALRQEYSGSKDYYKCATMPIVITTSSIALQNAIANDYVPEISQILLTNGIIDTPIKAIVRKGKSHYACDLRLLDYMSKIPVNKEPFAYADLFEINQSGRIDLDFYDNLNGYIKRRVCVPKECNLMCSMYKRCRYFQLTEFQNSYSHDIQICNHGLFLADIQKRVKTGNNIIPNYQAAVIDEAHKILEAARQSYGVSVERTEFKEIVDCVLAIKLLHKKGQDKINSYCDSVLVGADTLFHGIACDHDALETERRSVKISNSRYLRFKKLISDLQIIYNTLEQGELKRPNQNDLRFIAKGMIENMQERLGIYCQKNYLHWIEIPKDVWNTKRMIGLYSIPIQLNQMLYRDLWRSRIPMILTSGTLSIGGDFLYIKKKFGIEMGAIKKVDEITRPSPFNYKENMLLYLDGNLPFPDSKNAVYISSLTDKIESLIKATHGHTAVLFTSYRVMELVHQKLKKRIRDFPLIVMDKGTINPIENFKNSGNGILFAAGSCWEGIDIAGDILSSLVIVKLPFPIPDPISEFEQSMFGNEEQYKKEVVTSEMLIRLKQGAGRLIRKESDVGVLSILDSRLKEGSYYYKMVKGALPKCSFANSIDDVNAFIRRKKSDDYFI